MLQHPTFVNNPDAWQQSLANAVRDPKELLQILELDEALYSLDATHEFPLRVPRAYLNRIKKGDLNDPLLKQVFPLNSELKHVPGFNLDPVGDQAAVLEQGLLQKYQGRALVMATGACAIHCRYCFRRHFPYSTHAQRRNRWQTLIDALSADDSISEVILSGGDPLSIEDKQLAPLAQALEEIPHLKRLRIHSRFPIVLPERITPSLIDWFSEGHLQKVMVIHCNHPNEIDQSVQNAMDKLNRRNVTLLNQAVLLKGINDDSETLTELSEKLFEMNVIPYYLHMLDKVKGAAHFDVSEEKAVELIDEIRRRLPGYLVPSLVREIAGRPYKQPI